MLYEIRFCHMGEYRILQAFIKKHWNEDHIFTKSKAALDFQHLDRKHKRYNFIIAYNKEHKEFDAILGFILPSQYNKRLKDESLWLSMWKSLYPSLGLKLLKSLEQILQPKQIIALGLSPYSRKFYTLFNYHKVGILHHFYIKNEAMRDFKLAHFTKNELGSHLNTCKYKIRILSICEFKNSKLEFDFLPRKDKHYFIQRYYKHPFYEYKNYGIYENGELVGSFFARMIEKNNARCIFISDWLGKFPKNLYNALQILLQKNACEFISLICYIKNFYPIYKMGFKLLDTHKDVIPVHFEPFIRQNQNIYFALKNEHKKYAIFKGDSDQDRINQI